MNGPAQPAFCGRPTKDGTPCVRALKPGARTCWQHAKGIKQFWKALSPFRRFIIAVLSLASSAITLWQLAPKTQIAKPLPISSDNHGTTSPEEKKQPLAATEPLAPRVIPPDVVSAMSPKTLSYELHQNAKEMRDLYENYWNGEDQILSNDLGDAQGQGDSVRADAIKAERVKIRRRFDEKMTSILTETIKLRTAALSKLGTPSNKELETGKSLEKAVRDRYKNYSANGFMEYADELDSLAKRVHAVGIAQIGN